jgi:hypothetical protein
MSEDKVFWKGHQWMVTQYGLEAIEVDYPIEANRLNENDWLQHMAEKTWIDLEEFIVAYALALVLHGRAKMTPNQLLVRMEAARIKLDRAKECSGRVREYIEKTGKKTISAAALEQFWDRS